MADKAADKNSTVKSAEARERFTVQLDAETGKVLDKLCEHAGAQAGAALGITVSVSRADMVRSLVRGKSAEVEAPAPIAAAA